MSEARNWAGLPYRSMTVDDVNDLVEFTHQPYMYRRQEKRIRKRFGDLGAGIWQGDLGESNQQAISVLRFALQVIAEWTDKGPEAWDEIIRFAEAVGNVEERECYRGETRLRFSSDEQLIGCHDTREEVWLEYAVRVSGSYKNALWADLERMESSNSYSYCGFIVDARFVDDEGATISDGFFCKGGRFANFRVRNYLGKDRDTVDTNLLRCRALAGLVDFLATLHLCEVELRVVDCVVSHQTNTLIARAWRAAFEALGEVTQRNDKYGKRKPKYRVMCCADCMSPRIVKRGKNAVRCPLCSNNNTKEHKGASRHVY